MMSRLPVTLTAVALVGCLTLLAHAEKTAPEGAPAWAAALPSGPVTRTDAPAPGPLPTGEDGALISFGRNIIRDTPRYAGTYIKAGMSCEACHLNAGTKAHAGSLLVIYAKFPQYNKRSNHYITLQDRLAECFLYSMNGTPPAYSSREMIAMTAYIAYLSKGAVVGAGFPGQGLITFKPEHAASSTAGAKVYGQRCSACHGASGQGVAMYPALWGPKSFNAGAGMHRLATMSAFVRYNMPYGGPPNVLSKQEAYDVSAFVLSHPRPHFDKTRLISFPAQQAGTF
jgi:thiosulfate dehydrogenase